MSPITVNDGVEPPTEQIIEHAEYCARILGAAEVAPFDVIVTPDPAANVT